MQLFKKKAYTLYYEDECINCVDHNVTIVTQAGIQIWTGCNLNVTTYRDGTPIPQVTDQTDWSNLTTGAWCHINNDPANDAIYGKLYNWYAVNDTAHGGLAPLGYHVPSYAEWDVLIDSLGGDTVAGGKLKEVGLCHWLSPNTDATDQVLFTALPGGFRGGNGSFGSVGAIGQWWTSTEFDTTKAWMKYLLYNYEGVGYGQPEKNGGMSVRLIQDPQTEFDFTLSQTCSGLNITLVADSITGGTGPYQFSTTTFSNITDALDNTTWATASTSKNYPLGNVPGIYWVSIKDSLGMITASVIDADCWNSLTVNREQGFISLSGSTNGTIACGYPAPDTDVIYVATHVVSTLSVGDRVFLGDLPSITPFNGSTGIPPYDPMYWKISLLTEFSPCTGSGTRALIDKDGFITELYCCP